MCREWEFMGIPIPIPTIPGNILRGRFQNHQRIFDHEKSFFGESRISDQIRGN